MIDVSEKSDGVVERFLDRMVAHDWDGMAACLSDDVERVGPFLDTYRGKPAYVAFLNSGLASPDHSMFSPAGSANGPFAPTGTRNGTNHEGGS